MSQGRTLVVAGALLLGPLLVACPAAGPPAKGAPPASSESAGAGVATAARRDPVSTKAWLCECHRRSGIGGSCEEMGFDDPDQDCLRTYSDCQYVLGCLRGEPGALPKCLPGYRNAGIGRCTRICSTDAQCAPEEACSQDMGSPPVCWPK